MSRRLGLGSTGMPILDLSTRRLVSAAIEILIDILDRADGDADFEDESEGEPELNEMLDSPTNADSAFLDKVGRIS